MLEYVFNFDLFEFLATILEKGLVHLDTLYISLSLKLCIPLIDNALTAVHNNEYHVNIM